MVDFMLDYIKSAGFINYFLINFAFTIAISICVSVAIKIDTKSHNIKNGNLWTCFGFFFSLFAGFIYLISRQKLIRNAPKECSNCGKSNPKEATACIKCNSTELIKVDTFTKRKQIICIILIVVSVLCAVSSRAVNNQLDLAGNLVDDMLSEAEEIDADSFNHKSYHPNNTDEFEYYYDMKKNSYIDNFEVTYYTESGDEYIYEYRRDGEGLICISKAEFHKANECFVNKDGYLIFDASLHDSVDDLDHSAQKDGETYYLAAYVSWDKNGDLVDNSGNYLFIKE